MYLSGNYDNLRLLKTFSAPLGGQQPIMLAVVVDLLLINYRSNSHYVLKRQTEVSKDIYYCDFVVAYTIRSYLDPSMRCQWPRTSYTIRSYLDPSMRCQWPRTSYTIRSYLDPSMRCPWPRTLYTIHVNVIKSKLKCRRFFVKLITGSPDFFLSLCMVDCIYFYCSCM